MNPKLPETEETNPRSRGLDELATAALVELLIAEQHAAVDAVLSQAPVIAQVVEEIAKRLKRGGRVHYVGAGSSGRIATLDASEMPPTFGTQPELLHAHMAGGAPALVRSVEGAEDDADAGDAAILHCFECGSANDDAVIGISASGTAPFVIAAIARARLSGAFTVGLTSVADSPLAKAAQTPIVTPTGPEVLAGSTRLKAGTAQKVALNAISTAVMVRLGKVHDNLMVDVVATNRKLRGRALRLVQTLAKVEEADARELLEQTGGSVKVAVVMHRRNVDAKAARTLLERAEGRLRNLL